MSDQQPENVGAPRPTGKRQLAGVSTTSTASYESKRVVPAEAEEKSGNKVVNFLPEVVQEMRKVIWPTAKQMVNYTLIVFAFLILMTALVAGVDFIVGLGVERVLT